MKYKDRYALRRKLDSNGIEKLVRKLLKHDDYLDIWRACHGGVTPATGLIHTLAGSKCTTLKDFRDTASEVEPERSKTLLDIIDNYREKMATSIDKLPRELEEKILSEISANPFPVTEQQHPLWKSIADAYDIDMTSIDNLDIPARRAAGCESMTMQFLEIVNQRHLSTTVAWLANGLLAVGRRDVIRFLKCFDDSGEHLCERKE